MIEIKLNNKEKIINGFNVHDALIVKFEYKYDERAIYLNLDNLDWGYNIEIKFENVIYFETQSCNFFGKGYNVLNWELVDEKKILNSLYQKANRIKNCCFELIKKEGVYFATKFLMNSGDEILICCEKILVEENVVHINKMLYFN